MVIEGDADTLTVCQVFSYFTSSDPVTELSESLCPPCMRQLAQPSHVVSELLHLFVVFQSSRNHHAEIVGQFLKKSCYKNTEAN